MMKRKKRWALVSGAMMVLVAGEAWAHRPLLETRDIKGFDDAVVIDDPTGSYAIYGQLQTKGDVDFYRFEVKQPLTADAGMLVPVAPGYREFYPTLALVGPGLPPADLPFPLPSGWGAVVVTNAPVDPRPEFFEEFSRTHYFRSPESLRQPLAATGAWYLAVWHPQGEIGSYVLTFGHGEKWGWKAIAELPRAMKVIKSGEWIIKR
jgi:hypothetical protein